MDSFPAPNPGQKRANLLKAIAIEVSIITLLTVVLIIFLSYFHIIDFGFITGKNVATNLAETSNQKGTPLTDTQNSTSTANFTKQINGALVSGKIINQYEGKITLLDFKEGIEKDQGNFKYKAKINILGKGVKESTILFDGKALSTLKVTETKDSKVVDLQIGDLKVNDRVGVVVTRSLNLKLGTYEFSEIIITRLSE